MASTSTEDFLRKLQEFEKLIRYAAYRYRIPGVLDQEDLYQEGLMILDNMFRKYDFNPDTDDFRKMFKTELWHGLSKVLKRHKQAKRDWRKVVNKDYSAQELAADVDSDLKDRTEFTTTDTPEELALRRSCEDDVSSFLEHLTERLDDEAKVILSELLYPREWKDVPDEFKVNSNFNDYQRVPKNNVPRHIIADLLGLPRIRVKRAVTRIRRVATEVAGELGMNLVQTAGMGWLSERKKSGKSKKPKSLLSSSVLLEGAD